jgi:CRISPR-associated endonuclease Csn1
MTSSPKAQKEAPGRLCGLGRSPFGGACDFSCCVKPRAGINYTAPSLSATSIKVKLRNRHDAGRGDNTLSVSGSVLLVRHDRNNKLHSVRPSISRKEVTVSSNTLTHRSTLALDIGSNSVGSVWIDHKTSKLTTGTSIFPAGVDESDDKRGEPKNAKRRMTRRTRITLARRAARKRELRLKLISSGLLPAESAGFKALLEATDPWALRRKGLDHALTPHEFGRVLLHLAQRRGALGLHVADPDEEGAEVEGGDEDGKVKEAIGAVRAGMLKRKARTFGEFLSMVRDERVRPLTSADRRASNDRIGPRVYRDAIRNRAGAYEHCADRPMIRDEFIALWKAQKAKGGTIAGPLTDELRLSLDNEQGDSTWRQKGLLFGQRRATWDLGTLGRCVLEPTERCAPHADMYASRYLVIETVNNLRILEGHKEGRPLTAEEREKIIAYLSGPLGMETPPKRKGKAQPERPKRRVSVTDLRQLMGWGKASKTTRFRFNIESDEDRLINTDWFRREIIHGVLGADRWAELPESIREGLNRAILKHDPEQARDAENLKAGVTGWGTLTAEQADRLIAAWRTRPKPDAKRLNMSRRAVRNMLTVMDRRDAAGTAVPWPVPGHTGEHRWLTQPEARKMLAEDADFRDATTGQPFDRHARDRYATGAKGLSARDRHYLRKHGGDLPPAPMLSNPVVRKAIHEVRRHVVEYIRTFGRKPDEIIIELAREASMGAKDADRVLFQNRLRNRIRNDIIDHFDLAARTATQQRAAVDRVVLCTQQNGHCPLCGKLGLTALKAAKGEDCELAHITPSGSGGHNGLGNLVLAHITCNRVMSRRTPRQFWEASATGGFDEGMRWVEAIYGDVQRPRYSEVRSATGGALWSCYFTGRDDKRKIEQFRKDVNDIQEMTQRQEAATKHATRAVMAYFADALYEGKGLPERGGERRIFATDGVWTSRLRREWGLFFDSHAARAKGLSDADEKARKEKNRGDHRHHAIDAVVIGLSTAQVRNEWKEREKQADADGVNTADAEDMENYRRAHRLRPPPPFDWPGKSVDECITALRDAVKASVFGPTTPGEPERPISHRPVKRKLIGFFHKETMYGPVVRTDGTRDPSLVTVRTRLAELSAANLRVPAGWDAVSATINDPHASADAQREARRKSAALQDPAPGPGIVRDRATRDFLRRWIAGKGLPLGTPDDANYRVRGGFSDKDLKRVLPMDGTIPLPSGVPLRSVVVLRSIAEPVVIARKRWDASEGKMGLDPAPAAVRLYESQSNHHYELRVALAKNGKEVWTGEVVSTFETAQRKLNRLRAFRTARIPKPADFRKLPKAERRKLTPLLRAAEQAHPLVDRSDNPDKGGRFVMSLCEGETLLMRDKNTNEVGYFVVAKMSEGQGIVMVPHWDARAAGERKDAEGRKVPDSKRLTFAIQAGDFKRLAPPGHPHAIKVRVSPLGVVTPLIRD